MYKSTVALVLWVLAGSSGVYAVTPTTANISNIPLGFTQGANVSSLVAVGEKVIFPRADHYTHGTELWVSDGTSDGTYMIKDVAPGLASGIVGSTMAGLGEIVLFEGGTSAPEKALWRTDGTEAGTYKLKDPTPPNFSMTFLGTAGNLLYFRCHDGTSLGLWRSDGTESGTFRISSISPVKIVDAGTSHYLYCTNALYTSDGTESGTQLVVSWTHDSSANHDAFFMNGFLYFNAKDSINGSELWVSNGTSAGTSLFKDLNTGTGNSNPSQFVRVDNSLFFSASTSAGNELWRTDGTVAGTALVKDLTPTGGFTQLALGRALGGLLFFHAFSSSSGFSLHISDGTADGTQALPNTKDLYINPVYFDVEQAGDSIYFIAGTNNAQSDLELWRTNGTAPGTYRVKDIGPGTIGGVIGGLTTASTKLFFGATTPDTGAELWVTDGTEPGTTLVKDILPGGSAALLEQLTMAGATGFFKGYSRDTGWELWKSDGTVAGTTLVKDIFPGKDSGGTPFNSDITMLTAAGDRVYFRATHNGSFGLWRSDGTENGTIRVDASDISRITAAGADIHYVTSSGVLKKLDGATGAVTTLKSFGNSSYVTGLFASMGGNLYFIAQLNGTGAEFWRTDGTAPGTVAVKDIPSWTSSSSVIGICAAEDVVYIAGQGQKLWKSDGTASGTVLVKNWGSSGSPTNLKWAAPYLYFTLSTADEGLELWRTDGTTAGTILPKQTNPGPASGNPTSTVTWRDHVAFFATDSSGVRQLWISDGTTDGTRKVADVPLTSATRAPTVVSSGSYLFFSAEDPSTGCEVWFSDGSTDGTYTFADIHPGGHSSQPGGFQFNEGRLFWTAWNLEDGLLLQSLEVTHDLELHTSPPHGGIVVGSGSVPAGVVGTLSAQANPGYEFVGWTGGVVNASQAESHTFMDRDRTFTAQFALAPTYSKWVGSYFTPEQLADTETYGFDGDSDMDTIANGLEFLFRTDPRSPTLAAISTAVVKSGAQSQYVLELTLPSYIPAGVQASIEHCSDLGNTWAEVATRSETGSWETPLGAPYTVLETTSDETNVTITFTAEMDVNPTIPAYYRLNIAPSP